MSGLEHSRFQWGSERCCKLNIVPCSCLGTESVILVCSTTFNHGSVTSLRSWLRSPWTLDELSDMEFELQLNGHREGTEPDHYTKSLSHKLISVYSKVAMVVRQWVYKECGTFIEDSCRGPFSWYSRTKLREQMNTMMNI